MIGIKGIVIGVISGVALGGFASAWWVRKQYDAHCEKLERDADKFSVYYANTLQWTRVYQKGNTMADYFEKKGYKSVAVYGLNNLARLLMNDLKESKTEVLYGIDRNADNLFLEMDVYRPDEELPEVDICVVALPELYKDICNDLSHSLSCPIVSIEDVIWES